MSDEEFTGYAQEFAGTVYRVAFHTCKNAADSEDVLQDVLLKLYQEKTPFESREHVRRWLIRVAVNQSRKLLRSAWFRRSRPLEDCAALAHRIRELKELGGLRTRLSQLGDVDIGKLAHDCAVHPLMKNNPVKLDETALVKMFEALR